MSPFKNVPTRSDSFAAESEERSTSKKKNCEQQTSRGRKVTIALDGKEALVSVQIARVTEFTASVPAVPGSPRLHFIRR